MRAERLSSASPPRGIRARRSRPPCPGPLARDAAVRRPASSSVRLSKSGGSAAPHRGSKASGLRRRCRAQRHGRRSSPPRERALGWPSQARLAARRAPRSRCLAGARSPRAPRRDPVRLQRRVGAPPGPRPRWRCASGCLGCRVGGGRRSRRARAARGSTHTARCRSSRLPGLDALRWSRPGATLSSDGVNSMLIQVPSPPTGGVARAAASRRAYAGAMGATATTACAASAPAHWSATVAAAVVIIVAQCDQASPGRRAGSPCHCRQVAARARHCSAAGRRMPPWRVEQEWGWRQRRDAALPARQRPPCVIPATLRRCRRSL